MLSEAYSDSTVSSCYQYDIASPAVLNGLGRMVREWTQRGPCPSSVPASGLLTHRSFQSYDAAGRLLQSQQRILARCTSGSPFTLSQTYDLAGNTIGWSNGTGTYNFNQTFDAGGRPTNLSGTPGGTSTSTTLFSAASYNPANALQTGNLGAKLALQRTYDSRLRVTSEAANVP